MRLRLAFCKGVSKMAKITEIYDFSAPELDVFVRLTGAQLRSKLEPEKGIFIAESPTVIDVAMNSGMIPTAFLTDKRLLNSDVKKIIEKIEKYQQKSKSEVPIYTAEREVLAKLTGFELTRGALCAMKRPKLKDTTELLKNASRVAVLEEVCDSTNIGALFRCAAALGADAVLVTPTCCDPLCRRAVRVSMGTVFQVPWTKICDTPREWAEMGVDTLHRLGFKTAAMALSDNSVDIDDEKLNSEPRLAIILGTEGDGLAKTTIAKCDYTVKIPMSHGVDSLNVAAAGAVALWQLCKKKNNGV